uniref:Uncharacterized protein n=1 Tax=Alexandrium andersonii TaxID=327968 RepID=A0A7S2AS48_9DINO|mmetsp:Transcript_17357/g.39169  ORF Transcript_17357/g.39169 Transcript_17357/m.39169 type:complete len:211 (+) Transcript_17357:69-701(+)
MARVALALLLVLRLSSAEESCQAAEAVGSTKGVSMLSTRKNAEVVPISSRAEDPPSNAMMEIEHEQHLETRFTTHGVDFKFEAGPLITINFDQSLALGRKLLGERKVCFTDLEGHGDSRHGYNHDVAIEGHTVCMQPGVSLKNWRGGYWCKGHAPDPQTMITTSCRWRYRKTWKEGGGWEAFGTDKEGIPGAERVQITVAALAQRVHIRG